MRPTIEYTIIFVSILFPCIEFKQPKTKNEHCEWILDYIFDVEVCIPYGWIKL